MERFVGFWKSAWNWMSQPLFTIDETDFTLIRLIGLILIFVFTWWISRIIEKTFKRIASKHQFKTIEKSNLYALGRISRYLIWASVALIGINFIGFDLSSLAIIGGTIGVGIGFGLQNIVSNFISGIIILLEKSLKVGDFVDLQSGVVGTVLEINIRYTRVMTRDGLDILVPNSEFVNGRVINWTYGDDYSRIHVPFGLPYGVDKDLVKKAVIEAALTVEGTINEDGKPIQVWLVNFGESSLDFELVVWITKDSMVTPQKTRANYLWAIESNLRKYGIEIPFPQRDLHLKSGNLNLDFEGKKGSATFS